MKVGWIGAGRMGSAMATCASLAGHTVRVYANQIHDEPTLVESGATVVPRIDEAVLEAELICICLFRDDQVRKVMLGDTGAMRNLPERTILAIHTSGSSRLARDLDAATPPGVRVLDAPFSGQVAGDLTVMVGGAHEAFELASNVFRTYSREVTLVGELGAAQRLKLINQFLFRANAASAETALQMLEASGIDRQTAASALMSCSGSSWALNTRAQGTSIEEFLRNIAPYFETYLTAARDDNLDVSSLLRRGDPEPGWTNE